MLAFLIIITCGLNGFRYVIIFLEVLMSHNKITLREVANSLREIGAPCGQHYEFARDIDTSECEWFFGTRCPYNVHVTDKRRAHIDKFDPRYYTLEHIEEATGIPPWMTVLLVIGGLLGLTAYLSKRN